MLWCGMGWLSLLKKKKKILGGMVDRRNSEKTRIVIEKLKLFKDPVPGNNI